MSYTRRKITAKEEQDLVTGLIVSDRFLQHVVPILRPELLQNQYAVVVARWCQDFFKQYDKAPFATIQDIFASERDGMDGALADQVALFLEKLSERYAGADDVEHFNADYHIDNAERYLKQRSLSQLSEKVDGFLAREMVLEAEAEIATYKRVERPTGEGISVFDDKDAIINAFAEDTDEELFYFPGDLGKAVGPMCRDDLVAIAGPAKRGKCLSGNCLITLQDGSQSTVKEIVEHRRNGIYSVDNNLKIIPSEILEYYNNGNKDCYKIRTRTGREITITKNHPLYEFGKKWISIDDGLSVGDYIAVPKKLDVFGIESIPVDHVSLMAYLIADGGLTGNEITYTKKDADMKQDVIRIIHDLGDAYREDDELTIAINKGWNGPQKSETKKLLINYGLKFCKSIHKEIPQVIFRLNRDLLKQFLNILFSGDGSIFEGGIEYSSGSKTMIYQVQHLLLRFGIVSKVTSKNIDGTDYYRISIRSSFYIKLFCSQIGFSFNKETSMERVLLSLQGKQERSYIDIIPGAYRKILMSKIRTACCKGKTARMILDMPGSTSGITISVLKKLSLEMPEDTDIKKLADSDILWDRIEGIEFAGNIPTYDLTVPEHHNFIANDICAHNTWWLIWAAILAVTSKLNVAFFSLEMTERQMIRRIYQSLLGETKRKPEEPINVPEFDEAGRIFMRQVTKLGVNGQDALKKKRALKRLTRGAKFKLICVPAYSMSVGGMAAHLDNMEHFDGFIPDVIVCDYADILRPETKGDHRNLIDESWRALRALAQKRHCLVFTGTHSGRATFTRDMGQGDITEDIRKLNHVACMIGLNEDKDDRDAGCMRVVTLAQRHEGAGSEVTVLKCLDIGKPYLDSRFSANVRRDT
jgi:intein/homing endonuclease